MGLGRIGVARVVATAVAIGLGLFGFGSVATATADGHNQGGPGSAQKTTLDACGYFYGMQTAVEGLTTTSGSSSTTTDKGTWTGVWNNYSAIPVTSLGMVQGSFSETFTEDNSTGYLSGTEIFQSNAGSISQTYALTSSGWVVNVSATRDLFFLTSNTAGQCYSGPFPRP